MKAVCGTVRSPPLLRLPGFFYEAGDVRKIGRGTLAEVLFAEGCVRVIPIV